MFQCAAFPEALKGQDTDNPGLISGTAWRQRLLALEGQAISHRCPGCESHGQWEVLGREGSIKILTLLLVLDATGLQLLCLAMTREGSCVIKNNTRAE